MDEERDKKIWAIVRWLMSQGVTPDDDVKIQSLFDDVLSRSETGEVIDSV